jgi:hypothetical protein
MLLKDNALIVNALQRCATVVVQNSLREGPGLTVTVTGRQSPDQMTGRR